MSRTLTRWFVPTALVIGVLTAGSVAGAQSTTTTSSTSSSSKSTSPDAWASGVCSAVQTWLDSVESTVKGVKGAGSLDAAASQAKDGIKSATDSLTSSISALGTPSTGDGKKAKNSIDDLSNELQSVSKSIQSALANSGSTPVAIAGTLADVGSDLGKAESDVQNTATTLKGLKPNGALKTAFQTEPSCKQLKNSL